MKDISRRKLGIVHHTITGLPRYNLITINPQRYETEDSIGLFALDFVVLIKNKSPNALQN